MDNVYIISYDVNQVDGEVLCDLRKQMEAIVDPNAKLIVMPHMFQVLQLSSDDLLQLRRYVDSIITLKENNIQ